MLYFVIDFPSRTIFSLLNSLPCYPASGKKRNLVYVLQKDHRSRGGAEARHSRRWWKHTSGLELTLISSVAAAELRCTAQAFCQIYWLRAHNHVNMMLPLLTFPTPVNIV